MDASHSLPVDVMPCLGGDVIITLHGQLSARFTPEQRKAFCKLLCDTDDAPVTWLDTPPVDKP
jgi:hypothetical protein